MPRSPLIDNNLHVWFILDAWFPFTGGGQVYARELKLQLETTYGVNVTLFYPWFSHILYRSLWSLFLPISLALRSVFQPIDLLHSQGFNSGLAGKLTSIFIKKPIVHTIHGSHFLDQRTGGLKYWLERWLLTGIRYDHQITVAARFLQYKNINKISVIPTGVNLEDFDQSDQSSQKKRVIWIGRDDAIKGYDCLQKVISLTHQLDPDIEFDIILNGKLSHAQLVKRLQKASIFLQTSRAEGFPITIIEAWACNLAVICTDVGDNRKIITEHQAGVVNDIDDDSSLSDAIIDLTTHPQKAAQMGQRGRKAVESLYTWPHIAQQTYQVYSQVITNN